ncbi:MAG: ComF family protein [bacterium]
MIASNRIALNGFLLGLKGIVSSLLQPLCLGCGSRLEINRRWVCIACEKEIAEKARCRVRKIESSDFCLPVAYVLDYSGLVSNLIIEFKYRGKSSLARLFSELIIRSIPWIFDPEISIVPVPMHKARQRERGYNQSELLSNEISRLTGLKVVPGLLTKNIETKAQASLTGQERVENLKDAFVVRSQDHNLSNVLLIDDVVTTGTTLRRCAEVLFRSDIKRVSACVIASD